MKRIGPPPALDGQGQQRPRRVQYHGIERHGPLGFGHHPAGTAANGRQPVGDGARIAHRCRQHQQGNARGQVDHGLFPDHAAFLVSQKMGLVEYHQVRVQRNALMHGIVKLVSQDFSGADDDGRIGALFAVSGEDTHIFRAEDLGKFSEFRVGEGFERRGVPRPPAPFKCAPDGLDGDPSFAGAGGGGHQAIGFGHDRHGLGLEPVRGEGLVPWYTDFRKYGVELRVGAGGDLHAVIWPFAWWPSSRRISTASLVGALYRFVHQAIACR